VSWTLARSVAKLYLTLFVAMLGAVLLVFLVGDFADRLSAYLERPLADVATLYWNKALVALHQLAPAAMLLAAGATMSTLRQRGEWTAMRSLGLSRWVVVMPIGAVTLLAAVLLVGFDELVVSRAGPTVDRLMAEKFNRWGDFRFFYAPRQWFRLDDSLVYVRSGSTATELHDVTVFELDRDFRVTRRWDTATLTHLEGSRWLATPATERRFLPSGDSPVTAHERATLTLGGSTRDTFLVRIGRPEFMPTAELREQLQVRARVGLPVERLVLALHNRFAYPVTGFAATMLALALALREKRRGHLTLALVEGIVVTMTLFGLLLVGKALVLGEHVPAFAAAWAPIVVLLTISSVMWWAAEAERRPRR
jgi:lipopolysaccharide export system permease protein